MRHQPDKAVLITEAGTSGDDSFERRRRRYLITMTVRALCIIGAAVTVHLSGWLAAAFVAGALVLPWTAVLIANDRPPKEAVRFRRFIPGSAPASPKQLTAGPAPDASTTDGGRSGDAGDATVIDM
jgi:Flp pilus assembly protein TadB